MGFGAPGGCAVANSTKSDPKMPQFKIIFYDFCQLNLHGGDIFVHCLEMGSSTDPGPPPPPIVVALSMPATIALYSRSSCCALSLCTLASSSGFRGGSTGLGSTTSHSDSNSWNRRPSSPFSLLVSVIHLIPGNLTQNLPDITVKGKSVTFLQGDHSAHRGHRQDFRESIE